MDYRRIGRRRKFYEEQQGLIEAQLENYFNNSSAKMNTEQYLMMCEQLGEEPDMSKIPADFNDFPHQIQEVIQIFSILPDNWEGMSGSYMGKDYTILPYLFDEIFEVNDKKLAMKYLLFIASIVTAQYAEKQKARQRQAKSKKGGIHVNG